MQKKRAPETALVSSIADSLMDALPVFHKHLLGVDTLQRTHHMPLSHLQILLMLRGSDMSIGEISLRLGIAKPNITPLVDALCEEGLVERIRDMLDRRVVNVHLLPAGQERLAALQDSMMDQVDQWAGTTPWPAFCASWKLCGKIADHNRKRLQMPPLPTQYGGFFLGAENNACFFHLNRVYYTGRIAMTIGSCAIHRCEPCQDRKVAAVSTWWMCCRIAQSEWYGIFFCADALVKMA